MILWRISNHANLLGVGGLKSSARWHTKGHPIVYLAESPSCALLETLVHLEIDRDNLPDSYQLLKIEVPDELPFKTVDTVSLAKAWRNDTSQTQEIGDAWLKRHETPLLKISSALSPETWNWLLNPAHPRSTRIRILSVRRHAYDHRLFKR